jgi:hypothetical protein
VKQLASSDSKGVSHPLMSVVGFCASTYLHLLRAALNSIFLLDEFPLMGKEKEILLLVYVPL